MKRFVYMAVALVLLTATLVLAVTLGAKTTSSPVPSIVQTTQSASALTTRGDVFSATSIAPYDHVTVSVYNTSTLDVNIAALSVLVSDNTAWATAADINQGASSVPTISERNCPADHSLAGGAKCFISIQDNRMVNLKVRAEATQALTLTTIVTGRKR